MFVVMEWVLEGDWFNFGVYLIYLVCLYELKWMNVLFFIVYELVDSYLEELVLWLVVGIYYFVIGKIVEVRRYFSKVSMMDFNFGLVWIGFVYMFVVEGEYD